MSEAASHPVPLELTVPPLPLSLLHPLLTNLTPKLQDQSHHEDQPPATFDNPTHLEMPLELLLMAQVGSKKRRE
jgi:hypothetical protein